MGSNKNKLFKVEKTEEQIREEKKDKFAGAFVMNPGHCSPTGFMLLGALNKYIHDHVIDEDISSELNHGRFTLTQVKSGDEPVRSLVLNQLMVAV
jgi:hypothetical protein